MPTKIEWCTETWNPVVGCSKVSTGCRSCYAERMAWRLAWMGNPHYLKVLDYIPIWNEQTTFVESALEKPLHWRKSRMVFVCSMGDLFHESVPFEWIDKVIAVAALCRQHTFMILTKRPARMAEYFSPENPRYSAGKVCALNNDGFGDFDPDINWPPHNLWLGVTAENQQTADERILVLVQIHAEKHFVSVEPMLESLDIKEWLVPQLCECRSLFHYDTYDCHHCKNTGMVTLLDWVICGGETGPGARMMDPQWARDLRDQCASQKVPFFFKKAGGRTQTPDDLMVRDYPKS